MDPMHITVYLDRLKGTNPDLVRTLHELGTWMGQNLSLIHISQAVRVSAKAKASARMGFLAFMVLLLVFSGQECALLLLAFSF